MAPHRHELTEEQWQRIRDLLPPDQGRPGRPPRPNRDMVNAILWVLRSGAPWRDLPERYPKWKSVHTRFLRWSKRGVWKRVLNVLAADLDDELAIVDASIVRVHQDASLPEAVFKDEWTHTVQANDVLDVEMYLATKRTGRGTRLSRGKKVQVWRVFEAYRARLDRGKLEQDDVIREARLYLERNPRTLPYVGVVADEVQDFRMADLELLRAMVPEGPNDLFVVGDAHQRIYRHQAALGAAGINIRGRSRRLRVNYRTTEKIRNYAVALFEGMSVDDLDDGIDSIKGYHSLRTGVDPVVKRLPTQEAEAQEIVEQVYDCRMKRWPMRRAGKTSFAPNDASRTWRRAARATSSW